MGLPSLTTVRTMAPRSRQVAPDSMRPGGHVQIELAEERRATDGRLGPVHDRPDASTCHRSESGRLRDREPSTAGLLDDRPGQGMFALRFHRARERKDRVRIDAVDDHISHSG